jgi:hypothetical protein
MATITVDTAQDVVDANDGKTSLREALATAAAAGAHVDIVFKESVFFSNNQATAIALESTLTVAAGTDVTIDGSLYYGGNNYGLKLSGSLLDTNILTVNTGAKVTLRDMTLQGSADGQHQIQAHYGTDGHAGADGQPGQGIASGSPIHVGTGVSGTHATDGSDAPNDAEDGRTAVGAIVNRGDLTLERVDIKSFNVKGGAGGIGGDGGRGGFRGNGDDAAGPLDRREQREKHGRRLAIDRRRRQGRPFFLSAPQFGRRPLPAQRRHHPRRKRGPARLRAEQAPRHHRSRD